MNKPIYLHVFDRELRTLLGAQFSDRDVCDIVYTGVLAAKYCYIGNSNLAESLSEFPQAVKLVGELEKLGCVKVLTTTINREEFIEARQRLYHKVKDRYPMYFESPDVLFPSKPQVLKDSTTIVLQANMLRSLNRTIPTPLIKKVDHVRNAITNRDGNGITIGILDRIIEMDRIERYHVGLLISENYNKRYLDVMGGCLLKGLPWIYIFDDSSDGNYDYQLYSTIMEEAFVKHIKRIPKLRDQAEMIFNLKENMYFNIFQTMLYDLIRGMLIVKEDSSLESIRWELLEILKPRLRNLSEMTAEGALSCLQLTNADVERKYKIRMMTNPMKTILYVVATDTEFEKVTAFYKTKGVKLEHFEIRENVYYNLGIIKSSQVYLVKSGMGAKRADASILTIKQAVDELKPDYMIMVGIAFGLKEEKEVDGKIMGSQHIGEILVSSEIIDYGSYKIFEGGIVERGSKIPADPTLLKRFSTAFVYWDKTKVHTGLIVTSDVLVNKQEFRQNLIERFPDAIGGEMEGCGFLANYQHPWILVKSICDFGYNKGDEYQGDAAMNAIEFVDFVLREYDL